MYRADSGLHYYDSWFHLANEIKVGDAAWQQALLNLDNVVTIILPSSSEKPIHLLAVASRRFSPARRPELHPHFRPGRI